MKKDKRRNWFRLSLEAKKSALGYAFTMPFAIGFALFFLYPFIQSMIFSVNELQITKTGYELTFVGLKNYYHALFVDPQFRRVFVESMVGMLIDIPTILMFSLFAATLLNQKFRGRLLARVIFFLPVILSAEIATKINQSHYMGEAMDMAQQGLFNIKNIGTALTQLKLPPGFVMFIIDAINRVPEIIRASGIQILIFLAALQSIPSSLYEAAEMEGATAWEGFWKITFPLMSPLFLVNIVYTIIDTFTTPTNKLMRLIKASAWGGAGFGVSAAMSWFYFAAIVLILGITLLIVSRNVYYES